MKKKPMPHQRKALRDIVPFAKKFRRLTVIMPCGTGKTMVQLWTAEALKPKTVLVLLPSLALLRQTLHEWMAETRGKRTNVLCVCSDQTVGRPSEDEIQISPEELGYPVTSNSAEIAAFLSKKAQGVKLVFSTYHSSPLVAVGMGRKFRFDLAVFDEAHSTAGLEDGLFSFALSDKNLRIKTRTFLTATPRHYNLSEAHDDAPIVYSMDDESVYGPKVHQLTFRKAVEQGIICDYEVLVSVVTNKMVGTREIETGNVLIKGEKFAAKIVAHSIALRNAIKRFGITKVFSFHPRVADAEEFTNGGPQSAVHHLPKDFQVLHVNGEMTAAFREKKLKEFRAAKRALVSNARCLTQGVDVPAVDLVAFFSKKRSLIDIVQATGRAMRRAPGKTKGYILVPLYVDQEQGETLEEAAKRSNFREVWAVLNAMREQDEALAETLSRIRINQGKDPDDGGILDDWSDIVTIFGPDVQVKNLRSSIATICVDRLTPSWYEMYGRLLAFKEKWGHCDVPYEHPSDPGLGLWVKNQRRARRDGSLSAERITLLDKVGFNWNPRTEQWNEMYKRLMAFKKKHGHCEVPQAYSPDPHPGRWVAKQREIYRVGTISAERIELLNKIGFNWNTLVQKWSEAYQRLTAFKKKHGHCEVPQKYPLDPQLAQWVRKQRSDYTRGDISAERDRPT